LIASIAISIEANAVIISTTSSGSCFLSSSSTSSPPISGSMTSTIAAAKVPLRASSMPFGPFSANATS
jgi:hypothetical protein